MTTAALALAWVGLVVAAAWSRRPPPPRLRALVPTGGAVPSPSWRPAALVALPSSLGRALRGVASRPADPAADGRLGRAAIAGLVVVPWLPAAAPLVAGAIWMRPAWVARRRRRQRQAEVVRDLPEIVDLFLLAAGAGLTVPLAVAAVARRGSGPIAVALGQAVKRVELGTRMADALDEVPARLGEEVRPLVAALTASDRYGVPLVPTLERLAADVRLERRRAAEEAARRVPVKLLFPLVLCTLPAFALLTVVPLLAGTLQSLRL